MVLNGSGHIPRQGGLDIVVIRIAVFVRHSQAALAADSYCTPMEYVLGLRDGASEEKEKMWGWILRTGSGGRIVGAESAQRKTRRDGWEGSWAPVMLCRDCRSLAYYVSRQESPVDERKLGADPGTKGPKRTRLSRPVGSPYT